MVRLNPFMAVKNGGDRKPHNELIGLFKGAGMKKIACSEVISLLDKIVSCLHA